LPKLKPIEYRITFTAGGLLTEETRAVISYLNEENIASLSSEVKHSQHLQTNSESARSRIVWELNKRYEESGQHVFDVFKDSNLQQQKILIFYTCMKVYQILFDFMFGPVNDKWLTRDLQLSKTDVERFLDAQSSTHPEVDRWAATTREKVTTVIIRMLNEVGLLMDGNLQTVEAPDHFWKHFVDFGDAWFLQAMLLNKEQRDNIING
jgi:hypothetical protein